MKSTKMLIGGCSSSGKTMVSEMLSQHFGMAHYPLDQIRKASDHPVFKMLNPPKVWDNETEFLVDIIKQKSLQLRTFIKQWCINTKTGVLEGEGIEPEVVNEIISINNLKVIYIIETDAKQFHTTLYNRSKKYRGLNEDRQKSVVAMNIEYSKYIQSEAKYFNQPYIQSQPWETLFQRVLDIAI